MKIRPFLVVFAVTAVLIAFCLRPRLHAQQPPPAAPASAEESFHRPSRFMLARHLISRLGLTDDQKKAGLAVLRNHRPALKPLVENVIKERLALHALSKSPTVDEAAIRAQSGRVAVVEAELAVQKAYLIHDLRAVATPEQLHTLDQLETDAESRLARFLENLDDWIANS